MDPPVHVSHLLGSSPEELTLPHFWAVPDYCGVVPAEEIFHTEKKRDADA